LYLHARSLTLLGDAHRDQGKLRGPQSAMGSYRRALSLYGELDIPRRVAQVELSLTVVSEMGGELQAAYRGAIIIEPRAANTGQNIGYSRQALTDAGIPVTSVMLISKPYMQRRAYATIRKAWPEAAPVCASEDTCFDEYLKSIGDDKLVIDMLVGDLQRIIEYPARGFAIAQDVPADVTGAYQRLIAAGYDSRLMKG
jgi:uncharacterized SAM-binding protein YcdF (DUF218 family)